jgi:hypothetical protein
VQNTGLQNCIKSYLNETHEKCLDPYASECKKYIILDVEMPKGLGCMVTIHIKIGGVPLIQSIVLKTGPVRWFDQKNLNRRPL